MRWRAVSLQGYVTEGAFSNHGLVVLKRDNGQVTIRCGFCQGKGHYASGAHCPSCYGRGKIELPEPVVPCGFCRGTGRAESHTTTSCPSCRGIGAHAMLMEAFTTCPTCRGRGREHRTRLSCHTCSGKGVIPD